MESLARHFRTHTRWPVSLYAWGAFLLVNTIAVEPVYGWPLNSGAVNRALLLRAAFSSRDSGMVDEAKVRLGV